MNGIWTLTQVNGAAIPSNGVVIPSSSDRLKGGTLYFIVLGQEGCEYSGLGNSGSSTEDGRVVVEYQLLSPSGAAQPAKTYAGTFDHRNITSVVTLQSDGRAVGGSHGASDLTFTGTLPTLGGLTLVFRRQ